MSDCKPSKEAVSIIRQMARALVEAGHEDPKHIVDSIHAEIQDHTPLWHSEIAAIVAGDMPKGEAVHTKTEIQQKMSDLKQKLRDTYQPNRKEDQQNKTRQTQLKKDIADLEQRIANKDFSKPAKPTPPTYNKETLDLAKQRDKLQGMAAQIEAKQAHENLSFTGKAMDMVLALKRAQILSSIMVYPKLTFAVLEKMLITPIDEMNISLLKHIPGIKEVAEKAPRYGQGFMAVAEKDALLKAFGPEARQKMRDKWNGVPDSAKDTHGVQSFHPILDKVGQSHGVVKTPAQMNEYFRTIPHLMEFENRQMKKAGLSDKEIQDHWNDPDNTDRLHTMANAAGYDAILQGDNKLVQAIQGGIHRVGAMGRLGKAVKFGVDFELPIVKVPSNFLKDVTDYSIGGAKGLIQWYASRAAGEMTPQQADYIMKNVGRNTTGALLLLGYIGANSIKGNSVQAGGYYDQKFKKKGGDLDYNSLNLYGFEVPHMLIHNPALEVLQMGASFARGFNATKGNVAEKATRGQVLAWKGLLSTLPFISATDTVSRGMADETSLNKFAADQLGSLVVNPNITLLAKKMDDSPLPRKPETFTDAMKMKVPYLREQVQAKEFKKVVGSDAKLDVFMKMKPEDKDKYYEALKKSINASRSKTREQKDELLDKADASYNTDEK